MSILEEISKENADRTPLNILTPILQGFARFGVKVQHLSGLLRDGDAMRRVARSLLVKGYPMTRSERDAVDTIESHRFIIAEISAECWQASDPRWDQKIVPYSEATLLECRKENWHEDADWHLIYLYGWEPIEILNLGPWRRCACKGKAFETIQKRFEIWQKHYADGHTKSQSGYRLINFRGRFRSSGSLFQWGEAQRALGEKREVFASATSVLEAWLLHYKATKEKFLLGLDPELRIPVGNLDNGGVSMRGFTVENDWFVLEFHKDGLGACPCSAITMKLPDL